VQTAQFRGIIATEQTEGEGMTNPFDDTAKTRYRRYFERRGIRAIPQYEVFTLSRATDLGVEYTEADIQRLRSTIFTFGTPPQIGNYGILVQLMAS
jgi:hypothetical protein